MEQTGCAFNCLIFVNKYRKTILYGSIFQGLVHNFTGLITETCQGN